MRAENAAGYGPYHADVEYLALGVPAAPTALALALDGETNALDVTWTRPADTVNPPKIRKWSKFRCHNR